jgi:hypothetical protein
MKPSTDHAAVFVVHLLTGDARAAGFRASVRRVDRDQPEFFTQPRALVDYFERQFAGNPSAGVAQSPGGPAGSPKP